MLLAVVFFFLAIMLWLLGQRAREGTGLPAGRVLYTDTRAWGRVEKPLFSVRWQLTGKPDYLVRTAEGVVPVEVKSGRAPAEGVYAAHLYQLAAYCLLVTEVYHVRPSHGLVKYADKTVAVDFTPALEKEVLGMMEALRADAGADDVARSHASPARCRACGFREVCSERLD